MKGISQLKLKAKILLASIFVVFIAILLVGIWGRLLITVSLDRSPESLESDKIIVANQIYQNTESQGYFIGNQILMNEEVKNAFTKKQPEVPKTRISEFLSSIRYHYKTQFGEEIFLVLRNKDGVDILNNNNLNFSNTLKSVTNSHEPQSSIEIDENGYRLHVFTPCVVDSNFYGTIEISFALDNLFEAVCTHDTISLAGQFYVIQHKTKGTRGFNHDYLGLYVQKNQFQKYLDQSGDDSLTNASFVGDFVCAKSSKMFDPKGIEPADINQSLQLGYRLVVLPPCRNTLFPILNISGKTVAVGVYQLNYVGFASKALVNKLTILSGTIALLIAFVITYFLSTYIVKNIRKLEFFIAKLGKGDFSDQLVIKSNDEIGDMANAIGVMNLQIRKIVDEIKHAADLVAGGSRELNNAAQIIAQGANEQAAASEEVSASMEQIQASINQNSENAKIAEKVTVQISHDVEIVKKSFDDSSNAMSDIIERIKVINEIAQRIDILAINAAIEAARAGEFGKGFNVVASEIRDLAVHTQQAASKIDEVSQFSISQIRGSNELLKLLIPEISKNTTLIQEISTASVEQDAGIMQINQALHQLTNVVQSNSANAEEMASSSQVLFAQSEKLIETISYFKTQKDSTEIHTVEELQQKVKMLQELLREKNLVSQSNYEAPKPVKPTNNNYSTGIDLNLNQVDEKEFEHY